MSSGETTVAADNRRQSTRVDSAQSVCVEAFDPADGNFKDVTPVLDAARSGLAFASKLQVYYLEMKIRVTYPYSSATQKHYTGKVVRIQRLDENFQRISVHLSAE